MKRKTPEKIAKERKQGFILYCLIAVAVTCYIALMKYTGVI